MHVIVWAFEVAPEYQAAFEAAYGAEGDWARLFRRGDGYVRCELLHSTSDGSRYVTLDFWESRAAFEVFKREFAADYQALDRSLERLTLTETLLGILTEGAPLVDSRA